MKSPAVLALIFAISAQAQQPPLQLTLAATRAMALGNNSQIAVSRLNAAAAHQVPKEYPALLAPIISGSVTAVGADSGSRLAAGGLNNPVLYNRAASGVLVNDLITDFGRTRSLVAAANLRAQAQDQVTDMSRADVLLATTRAYFGVLRAKAVLKVAQQTVTARQTLVDQVTALFNSQIKSQLDVSFAGVNLADARLLVSQATNDESAAEASLAAAVGLRGAVAFSLSEEAVPEPLPSDPASLIQQALQDRPELKDLRLEVSAAQRFAESERRLSMPTVAFALAAGVVPAGEPKVPGSYGAMGFNINIPVLNGGVFHARQSEAELREQAANERVKDIEVRIERDVRTAFLNASTALQRVNLTAQLRNQAEQALGLAQGRYDLGLSSIVELSQAQLNLTSAQIATASSQYDYQIQRALVDYAVGALR